MGSVSFAGKSILIVEDEPLIALELRHLFEQAGAHVFAAARLPHAMSLAQHPDIDVALLDYRIGDSTSDTLARRLHARGVPFVFYSGYGMNDELGSAVVVKKPTPGHLIVDAVRGDLLSRPVETDVVAPPAAA